MHAAKILLVADPPAGPKIRDHLEEYGDVALIRAKEFTTVPTGTEWVLVMNGGARGASIHSAAKQVGARNIAVPPGWSQMQSILDRAGFFKAMADANRGRAVAALTQRPFAGLTALTKEADVATALVIEGHQNRAEKVIAAAVEKVMEAADKAASKAQEVEKALTTAAASTTAEATNQRPSPVSGYALTPRDMERGMAVRIANAGDRRRKKSEILRLIFDRNPDATLGEADAALRAMSPDGRGISRDIVTGIRREVRVSKGLPPEPRTAPAEAEAEVKAPPEVKGLGADWQAAVLTIPLTEAPAVPSPTPPPAAPPQTAVMAPPVPLAGAALPPDVATAAKLLCEALEASRAIATYTLTYGLGSKPRQRWTATVENDSEV